MDDQWRTILKCIKGKCWLFKIHILCSQLHKHSTQKNPIPQTDESQGPKIDPLPHPDTKAQRIGQFGQHLDHFTLMMAKCEESIYTLYTL